MASASKLARCEAQRKVRYPTATIAIRAAIKSSSRRGVALRTYKCPHCGGYHLTRQQKREG